MQNDPIKSNETNEPGNVPAFDFEAYGKRAYDVLSMIPLNDRVFDGFNPAEDDEVEYVRDFLAQQIADWQAGREKLQARTLGEVVVKVTPKDFPTMEFLFGLLLKKDELKNRQAWLSMTEEEEKDRQHEVKVKTFAMLIRAEPLRVPGWITEKDRPGDTRRKVCRTIH